MDFQKQRMNEKHVVVLRQNNDTEGVDEASQQIGIISEIVKACAHEFIIPIIMSQRVYVHTIHIKGHMPNKVKVWRMLEYTDQNDDRGRKLATNCKVIMEDQSDDTSKTTETNEELRSTQQTR